MNLVTLHWKKFPWGETMRHLSSGTGEVNKKSPRSPASESIAQNSRRKCKFIQQSQKRNIGEEKTIGGRKPEKTTEIERGDDSDQRGKKRDPAEGGTSALRGNVERGFHWR